MFIDSEQENQGTPLGVRCNCGAEFFNSSTRKIRMLFFMWSAREHRTPKGVPGFRYSIAL
jgi:hypothetical protein